MGRVYLNSVMTYETRVEVPFPSPFPEGQYLESFFPEERMVDNETEK